MDRQTDDRKSLGRSGVGRRNPPHHIAPEISQNGVAGIVQKCAGERADQPVDSTLAVVDAAQESGVAPVELVCGLEALGLGALDWPAARHLPLVG